MYRKSMMFIALIALAACGAASAVEKPPMSIQGFEDSIRNHLDAGRYRETFAALSDYEAYLVAQYQPATFENGEYRSEAAHLSFTSPFEGWRSVQVPEVAEMGPAFQLLVALAPNGNQEATEKLMVARIRLRQVLERFLGGSSSEFPVSGEQFLLLMTQAVAEQIGMTKNHNAETMGSYRVVVADLATALNGPPICLMLFEANKDTYVVVLASEEEKYAANKSKVRSLIESMKFNVRPPDDRRISQILQASYSGSSLEVALARARALAAAGEYDAAVGQLDQIRQEAVKQMPLPRIDGNTYVHAAYNLRWANPDADLTWRFEALPNGEKMALLVEEGSIPEQGFGIMVLNMDLTYGAQATDAMLAQGVRPFLSMGGRGGAQAMGRIMGEKFIKVKGRTAYQAEVQMNAPVSVNYLLIDHGRTPVMVVMFIDARNYEEKLEKYLRIVEQIDFDYQTNVAWTSR